MSTDHTCQNMEHHRIRRAAMQYSPPEHVCVFRPLQVFTGNRPSLSLLFPKLDAFSAGQLLAIYEHRTAVQGFVWGLNSFDQWGVELGKVLAKQVWY